MTLATTELSPAERAVLECAAQGLTIAQTALRRQTSVETVRTQRRRVLQKLGARKMTQAIRIVDLEQASAVRTGAGPITPGQLRAFHAKCGALDRWLGREHGESKQLALAMLSQEAERELTSANDLNELEASSILDRLDEQLRSGAA